MSKNMISLLSSTGELYQIEEAIARQSKTISDLLDIECRTSNVIPIDNVENHILSQVINYLGLPSSSTEDQKKWDESFSVSTHITDLLLAANYLNIRSLLDLCCNTIRDLITQCKNPTAIRSKFNISNDFTPEEYKKVCSENQWAFESKDVPVVMNSKFLQLFANKYRISSIPDALMEEIFSTMPAKSLARCRCVSRTWAILIDNPQFWKLFSTRRQPEIIFVCITDKREAVSTTDKREAVSMTSTQPETQTLLSSPLATVCQARLSSLRLHIFRQPVNGLLFVRDFHGVQDVIFNPSTGKSFNLPKVNSTREIKPCNYVENSMREIGAATYFGYDRNGNQYKVLSMTTFGKISDEHQVLTLGEPAWRSIRCLIQHFPLDDDICINGQIYYPAAATADTSMSMIIAFTVSSETFRSIKYFETDHPNEYYKDTASLFDFNGNLGSFLWGPYKLSFELWVLNDNQ